MAAHSHSQVHTHAVESTGHVGLHRVKLLPRSIIAFCAGKEQVCIKLFLPILWEADVWSDHLGK